MKPDIRANWWLSAVGNSNGFCNVNNNGNANANNSSNSNGVRPISAWSSQKADAREANRKGGFTLFFSVVKLKRRTHGVTRSRSRGSAISAPPTLDAKENGGIV